MHINNWIRVGVGLVVSCASDLPEWSDVLMECGTILMIILTLSSSARWSFGGFCFNGNSADFFLSAVAPPVELV